MVEAEANVLAQQNAVSNAQAQLAQAQAQSQQSVKNGPGQIRVEQSRAAAAAAAVKQAQARVEQAKLNLSYTHITAPTAGIVNKKNVEVGANLSVGQDLMTIIPLTDLWVTANFKETQLAHMCPGQEVTLKVDAYGGRKFSGRITQVGGATGSMLSLFPPENATGNYVKVVQRIPVRIDFTNLQQEDGDYVLRPGLSVTPDVRIKGRRSPALLGANESRGLADGVADEQEHGGGADGLVLERVKGGAMDAAPPACWPWRRRRMGSAGSMPEAMSSSASRRKRRPGM